MASTPTLDRAELRQQYEAALEEYRFQVGLNWQRSQYFFVLNVGVLVAGATLLASHKVPRLLIALVFVVGALLAALSILANQTQQGYYRSARDLKRKIESELELGGFAVATTPGMGSGISRLGAVRTFLMIMLASIATVDLCGVALIAREQWWRTSPPARVAVIVGPVGDSRRIDPPPALLVVTLNGVVIAHRESAQRYAFPPVWLKPGGYTFWSSTTASGCSYEVTASPIQRFPANC